MLSIFDQRSRFSRRRLLTAGALGLGGLSLPNLLAARAASGGAAISGKSVIFLFQQGGPSQFETFDPKPEAADAVRTVTGVIPTSVPNVWFGDKFERLASIAHKLAIVRSYQPNNAAHNIEPLVGPDSKMTNLGAHYARVAGVTRAGSGMPTNVVLFPSAVSDKVPPPQSRGELSATGAYGSGFAPFVPGKGGQLQKDMRVNLPRERFFGDRRALLGQLDGLRREIDSAGQLAAADEIQRQAYDVLLGGGVAQALDLSREDPRVVALYDTAPLARGAARWNKVSRGKAGYYTAEAATIGKLLLLARRLCEAGAGFVTIHAGYAGVWDMHADGNNLNVADGMEALGPAFDHAVHALAQDLENRGLADQILLVATGEMGRTPRVNKTGGRDHWSRLAPLLLLGGGARGGQVIGQSSSDGGEPATEPHTPANLISTIMHTVFDVGQLRLLGGVPQTVTQVTEPAPIPGVV